MMHSSIVIVTCRWRRLYLLLLPLLLLLLPPSAFAFVPQQPMSPQVRTSRSLGVPLEMDPSFADTLTTTTSSILISAAAKATTVKAAAATATAVPSTLAVVSASTVAVPAVTTGVSSSSATKSFLAGSVVLIGIVSALKWNDVEYSEKIRESWEKIVDSTSSFGTKTSDTPSVPRMESSIPSSSPNTNTEAPVVATSATTSVVATTTTANPIILPNAKDATSPEALIDMMKEVGATTAPPKKKKRFILRLLKKIIMPWKKWSNL